MTEDEIAGWHHQLNGMSLNKFWEITKDREAWSASVCGVRSQGVGHDLVIEHHHPYGRK